MTLHLFSGYGAAAMALLYAAADLQYAFGAVADVFPPVVKKWAAMISAVAGVILFLIHSRTSQPVPPPPK